MMKIRIIFLIALQTSSFVDSQTAQAQEKFVIEKSNGCKLFSQFMSLGIAEQSVIWKGSCKDGLAHGEGELTWFVGDEVYWTEKMSQDTGLILELGNAKLAMTESDIYPDSLRTR